MTFKLHCWELSRELHLLSEQCRALEHMRLNLNCWLSQSVDTSEAMNYANNNDSLGWLDKVWKYFLTHNADTTQTFICMHQQYN